MSLEMTVLRSRRSISPPVSGQSDASVCASQSHQRIRSNFRRRVVREALKLTRLHLISKARKTYHRDVKFVNGPPL